MRKVNWGVLGAAKIAVEKVIPAMQRGVLSQVSAIASRNPERARSVAGLLGIGKSYGSYEELLSDPEIEAVYVPLPNHLHTSWSRRALQAGKHVLCEKPLALTAGEALEFVEAASRHPDLLAMEAFMYRFHPQWRKVREMVQEGAVGELKTIQTFFSYCNQDPANIRNVAAMGGGGILDIGCYPVSVARFLFGREPRRVIALVEYDPRFQVDRLASAILDFETGCATFTCATQLAPYQRVQMLGDSGRIEVEIPFNAPPDRPCRFWLESGGANQEIEVEIRDQYTVQGDLFSQAILEGAKAPTPLSDAVANLRVLDALVESARSSAWRGL